MRSSRRCLLVVLLTGPALVLAADEAEPDMEFLEYLGMWEETDEEWLIFEEAGDGEERVAADSADASEQAAESMENDDES